MGAHLGTLVATSTLEEKWYIVLMTCIIFSFARTKHLLLKEQESHGPKVRYLPLRNK